MEPAPANAHDAGFCFIDLWYLWGLLQLMLMMPAMGRIYWLPCWSPPQLMLMMPVSCFIDLWYLWGLLQLMLMMHVLAALVEPAPADAHDACHGGAFTGCLGGARS